MEELAESCILDEKEYVSKIDWQKVGEVWFIKKDMSQSEIARRLGVTHDTVGRQLRAQGVKKKEEQIDWAWWLGKHYRFGSKTKEELAEHLGVEVKTIEHHLKRLGMEEKVDWFYWGERYIEENLSIREVAVQLNTTHNTVSRNFRERNIIKKETDWKYWGRVYNEKNLTLREVVEATGTSESTVCLHFKRLGIVKAPLSSTIDWKDLGEKYYINGEKSQDEIGDMVGLSGVTVGKRFKELGIKVDRLGIARESFNKEGYKLLSSEYVKAKTPLEFICPRGHRGSIPWDRFNQGGRCLECSNEDSRGSYSITRAERNKKKWLKEECYVYKIRLYNESEEFYKVGVSINPKNRLSEFKQYYNVDTIELIETNLYDAVHLELEEHSRLEKYRYIPDIKFGGYGECFTRLDIEE